MQSAAEHPEEEDFYENSSIISSTGVTTNPSLGRTPTPTAKIDDFPLLTEDLDKIGLLDEDSSI